MQQEFKVNDQETLEYNLQQYLTINYPGYQLTNTINDNNIQKTINCEYLDKFKSQDNDNDKNLKFQFVIISPGDVRATRIIETELKFFKDTICPFIERHADCFKYKEQLCIFMEKVGDSSLFYFQKRCEKNNIPFDIKYKIQIILQLLQILIDLNRSKLMHRNIHHETLRICKFEDNSETKYEIRLVSIGTAKYIKNQQQNTLGMGAKDCKPEEILEKSTDYNNQIDVFSVGITICKILYGLNTFKVEGDIDSQDYKNNFQQKIEDFISKFKEDKSIGINENLKDLVIGMVQYKQDERIKADKIQEKFNQIISQDQNQDFKKNDEEGQNKELMNYEDIFNQTTQSLQLKSKNDNQKGSYTQGSYETQNQNQEDIEEETKSQQNDVQFGDCSDQE